MSNANAHCNCCHEVCFNHRPEKQVEVQQFAKDLVEFLQARPLAGIFSNNFLYDLLDPHQDAVEDEAAYEQARIREDARSLKADVLEVCLAIGALFIRGG